jgi:hypothetical protein
MGFDIYGVKPELVGERPEINWDLAFSEEKTKYHDALAKFEDDNPGFYFRNNVWWWRPLWLYICEEVAPDILTEEDKERGSYNDAHHINAIKANYIADKIEKIDAAGELDAFEKKYRAELAALDKVKCEHCNGSGIRNDRYVQGKCNVCINGMREHWGTNYPFEATNVREFAKFARASGGFEIS